MAKWTAAMLSRLPEYASCECPRQLAQELGVTMIALRTMIKKAGIRRRPEWTDQEIRQVVEMRDQGVSLVGIARAMGVGEGRINKLARRLGWPARAKLRITSEVEDLVRRRNAEEITDTDIARELGCDRHAVSRIRKRLGLPSMEKGKVWLSKIKAGQKRQLEAAGVDTIGKIRALAYRQFAEANGWPAELRPREVQVLNILAASGVPMTRRQLAERLGIAKPIQRKMFVANGKGGSYLAILARMGLVARIRKGCRILGQGPGRTCDYYTLGPNAIQILKERARAAITNQRQTGPETEGC